MKKTLILTTALVGTAFAANAAEVTVMSWGGAYTKSQVEAYHKPFTAETGIKVNSVDSDNPATPIKAQVEAGNVTVDVADVEFSDAVRLCDEGLLYEIDTSALPAAPDGTSAADDFIEGALQDCAVANIVWSTVFAYNKDNNPTAPDSIDDFFNTADFPGKRGLRKSAKATLEMALMADGVPAAILDFDLWVIPKGAPNKEAALEFISFSTDTQRLADQASWISYGPARKSSGALVGLFNDGKTEMAPHMPTAAANLENALVNNFEFWVDRDAELNERFNAWLAQ